MIRSLLIGATAGARALTPLAVVSEAASRGTLPADNGAPRLLANSIVATAASLLAMGEWVGDKQATAPDRIAAPGLAARAITGAIAGMALAPRRQRLPAALLGAAGAVGAAYLTFALREEVMRFGRAWTGAAEDALTLAAARLIVRSD
ncbi:MAG: DUF4126 domain-containing protein [Sphingomonas sp.]